MTDMNDTSHDAAQPANAPPATSDEQQAGMSAVSNETGQTAPSNTQSPSPPLEVAATQTPVEATPDPALASDALIAARAEAEWRVIGETVPGASHLRAGIPNQDAILHVRQSSARLPVIVSISDGHGSNKCFRSDRGSRFAVRIGADLLDELINGRHSAHPPSELESRVRASLTAEFIRRWRAAVEVDLKREPFSEEEFERMIEKDGAPARRLVEATPYLAYGATSLSFLLTPTYALYLQLGDGEMVTVSEQGEIGQPLPEDARLLANETTSLCLDKAADDFRFAVHPHGAGELPALIMMTTDGYYNSFSTTADFHQVGGDLIQMLCEEDGFGTVNRSVRSWLEEATTAGSGDDCTLAIICRMDVLKTISLANDVTSTTASPIAPSQSASLQPPSLQTTASPAPDTPDAATPAVSHEQPPAPKTD